MAKRKLNNEEIIKLIDGYKNTPCLWDKNSSAYKRADIRNKAWHELAKRMKMDKSFVKNKVKTLRGTYTGEKNKVDSRRLGQRKGDVYVSKLFWFEKMRFLDPVIIKRTFPSNRPSIEEKQEDNFDFSANGNNDSNSNLSGSTPEKSLSEDKYVSAIKNVLEFASKVTKKAANDEIDSFCQYLNTSLRKLSEEDALLFMQEMQQNLINMRLAAVSARKNIKNSSKQYIFDPISTSPAPSASTPVSSRRTSVGSDIISGALVPTNINLKDDASE